MMRIPPFFIILPLYGLNILNFHLLYLTNYIKNRERPSKNPGKECEIAG